MQKKIEDTGKRCLECKGRLIRGGMQKRWVRQNLKKPRKLVNQQYICIECGKRSIHYAEAQPKTQN